MKFKIGRNCHVDSAANQVTIKNGASEQTAKLEPRMMQVLVLLAEKPGEVLGREFLIDEVWGNKFVGEEALTQTISKLRKIFGDNAHRPQFIETISKTGYRLIAKIERSTDSKIPPVGAYALGNRNKRIFRIAFLTIVVLVFSLVAIFISQSLHKDKQFFQESLLLSAVPITSEPGLELAPSLSPWGDFLAYSQFDSANKSFDIFIKSTTRNEIKRLTNNSKNNLSPVWSPDGRHILFSQFGDGKIDICLKSINGGEERKLVSCAPRTHPKFAMAPDGKHIVLSEKLSQNDPFRIYLWNLESKERRVLSSPDVSYYGDVVPVFSADGKILAFKRMYTPTTGDIYTSNLVTGRTTKVTDLARWIGGLSWFDAEHLIYAATKGSYSSLWKIPSKGGDAEWLGGRNLTEPATSMDRNTLAFSRMQLNIDIWALEIPEKDGYAIAPMKIVTSTKSDIAPSISPDASKMAYISNKSGYYEIWICDQSGLNKKQLTFLKKQLARNLSWSPDGKVIAFTVVEDTKHSIFLVAAGGGFPSVFIKDAFNNQLPTWSTNGNSIYFTSDRKDGQQIWKKRLNGNTPKQITTQGGLYAHEISGGFLYLTRPDTSGVWRISANKSEPELVLPKMSNTDFKNWVVNSKGIYFIERTRTPVPAISFFDINTQEVKPILYLKDQMKYYSLMISADRHNKWLYYTVVDRAESDIMFVRL